MNGINYIRSIIKCRHQEFQFSLLGAQRIVGQSEYEVLNGSHIFISLCEYWYYLVLSSNIHVKGDKMKSNKNPVRLTFDSLCSFGNIAVCCF